MTPSDFGALQEGHEQMKKQLAEMQQELAINTSATKQLMDWLNAFEGTFKVLNGVGKIARPVGWIAGALASMAALWYTFIHGGRP